MDLSNNQLTALPVVKQMQGNIVESNWCFIDGIVRESLSTKKQGEHTVIKTPFDFIVGDGEDWAHGKSIKEALSDLNFKKYRQSPDELKERNLDEKVEQAEAINIYRAVTGACREGVRQWMNGKDLPETISIREIADLTKGAYGGTEFSKFFGLEVSK